MPSTRSFILPSDVAAEQQSVLIALMREVFVNEFPLVTRLNREPIGADHFDIISYDVRSRDYTLGAAISTTGATNITLNDVSPFNVGDVIEIGTERLEIIGNIVVATNTCDVKRGVEGTTAATALINAAVKLIGNSRTGAEIDQEATRNPRSIAHQYVQTFQFPVQVGGKANAISNIALPEGIRDIFAQGENVKFIELERDIEYTSVYGVGDAPATGVRTKQKGLKALIDPANVLSTTATGYRPIDFVADLVQKALNGGGAPDVALVANDFITALATWGFPVQRGTNSTQGLGLPIEELEVPFLGTPLRFIRSPQLKLGTAIVLTSSEIRMRPLREEFFNLRGNRGDAKEGEWLADMAIELVNPKHHAMREGISTYAAA